MALRLYGDGNIENVTSINTDISATELGYLNGTTGAIQDQISSMKSYGYFGYTSQVTIAAGTGVTVPFDTVYTSNGISLSSNSFTFSNPGIYALDWGCRPGTSPDVWSILDLYNSTEGIVGKSFGFGTTNPDVGARTAHFMAEITNVSVSYTLRMTRLSSMTISDVSEAQPDPDYPEIVPVMVLSIWRVG